MTRTIVASATREIVIGFDQPFCVIGERINPTGRKKLAAEMIEGNFDWYRRWRSSRIWSTCRCRSTPPSPRPSKRR